MESQVFSTEPTQEQKRKGRAKKLALALVIVAHIDFYFAQSLYLPLSVEQLFTLGQFLILADTFLLSILLIALLKRRNG